MEELKKRFEVYKQRLEEDPDYEMSDEMQEEYYAIQEELEMIPNASLQKEFNRLFKEYENPDGIVGVAINHMFPDGDGEFDLD